MTTELNAHTLTFTELLEMKQAVDAAVIVAITDLKGIIVYANDMFCKISRYQRAELIGQDHRIINSGYHPPEFFADLWQTIQAGRIWQGEIRNRAKDGSFYWVKTTIYPVRNQEGLVYRYISVRTDISARKKAEEEIQRLNEELEDRVLERTKQLEASNRELSQVIQQQKTLLEALDQTLCQGLTIIHGDSPLSGLTTYTPNTVNAPKTNTHLLNEYDLSRREYDVLRMLAAGATNKEISETLFITLHTVKAHVSKIIQKLGVSDRTQVTIKALREGLIDF